MRFTYNIIFGLKHFVNIHFFKKEIFFLSTTIFVYCKGRIKNLHFIFTSDLFLFGADLGSIATTKFLFPAAINHEVEGLSSTTKCLLNIQDPMIMSSRMDQYFDL